MSHLTRRPASDRDVYAWWWPAAEAHPHDRDARIQHRLIAANAYISRARRRIAYAQRGDARIQHRLIAANIGHARQRIAYAQRGLADCRRVIHRLDREWL